MRTLVLERPGSLVAADTAAPPAAAEAMALVRVHRVGVCGTDFHAWHGRQPFFTFPRVLGHELGVEILDVPAGAEGLRPGDLCAVEPYLNCGTCAACLRGRGNCCEQMRVMGVHVDGGMRERLLVPVRKLHRSATLDLDTLALVETLSVGAHAVARARPTSGDDVLVIGAGPIGLSVAAFAIADGARVVMADVSDARLGFSRDRLALAATLRVPPEQAADAVRAACGDRLPSFVFDATGSAASMAAAFGFVAHAGTLVFVGLVQADVAFHDPDFHRREMTLLASRNALPADFARVVAALESGSVDPRTWITHRATLDEVPAVFPGWTDRAQGVVKAMIEI